MADPWATLIEKLRDFSRRWLDDPEAPVRGRRRRVAKRIEARRGKLRFTPRFRLVPREAPRAPDGV